MSKRFVDTGKYRQAWRKLDPKLRAAFYWLTENSDAAGYWTIDLDHFKFECGYALDIERLIRETGAVEKHGAKVLRLVDFIETNYGTLKEGYNPHKPALRALAHHQLSSLNQASTKLEDEEEDEEEDIQEEKERAKEHPLEGEVKDEAPVAVPIATPQTHEAVLWPSFSDFWEAYGKSKGKPLVMQMWAKIPQRDREAIMTALPAYTAANEKQFRLDPERYLKRRAWEDEVIPRNQTTNGKPTSQQLGSELDRVIAQRYGLAQPDHR